MKPGGKYVKSPQYRSLLNCYVKSMLNLIDQIPFSGQSTVHIFIKRILLTTSCHDNTLYFYNQSNLTLNTYF